MWAKSQRHAKRGFTVVELLIVIVVIGILAAVVTVAYNGVTNNARIATAQNDLKSIIKTLESYKYQNNDTYPLTASAGGLKSAPGNTLTYVPNNVTSPTGYCATITNSATTLFLTNTNTTVQPGSCNVTNYVLNPSAETGTITNWIGPNSTTIVADTAQVYQGSYAIKATMPADTVTKVGLSPYTQSSPVGTTLQPNTTYLASVYVYVPSTTVDITTTIQGGGAAAKGSAMTTSVKNAWVRLSQSFTTGASGSGSITFYVLNKVNTTAGMVFWADGAMITQGTSIYTYADGSSPNWTWSGTANASSSSGTPL